MSYDETFFDWFCLLFLPGDRMETCQKEPFDQIFGPPRGRGGHKKWFEIMQWVVTNVFKSFNLYAITYLKLGSM